MKLKNYGNLVHKYASREVVKKYSPIEAESINEYRIKQLSDLKRFLKDDYKETADPAGNPSDHINNLKAQKAQIEKEIDRLERITKAEPSIAK